jgi:hypothetical protein
MSLAAAWVSLLILSTVLNARPPEPTWLDRPLKSWNIPGRAIPRTTTVERNIDEVTKRCALAPIKRNTSGERALADAGWVPFYMFDRQIVQGDVEVVGGLSGADGMCRPMGFNVFVFVAGRFAGTLSPAAMASLTDLSLAGGIRLAEDMVAADFARYVESDALCCPSGRVTVRYRIDRSTTPPVVVPVAVQPTRR